MQYYTSLLIAAILAFILSATLCLFSIRFSKSSQQKGNKDSGFRRMHEEEIPRLGGLGIVSGFWGVLLVLFLVRPELVTHHFLISDSAKQIYWLAPLSIATYLIGTIDDLIFIRARYKLLLQIGIAVITALTILPMQRVNIPFWGTVELGIFGILLSTAWIVGVMNAVNLIDGLDTLAGGIAVIALAGISLLSWQRYDMVMLSLSLILITSIAGFLTFNAHPARLFMGDGGSYFLGYFLAVLPMLEVQQVGGEWLLTPIILLGLPITDTLFSIIRRSLRGLPPFSPDKNHIHHRIIEKGLTHPQAVRRLHFVTLVFLVFFVLTSMGVLDQRVGFASCVAWAWMLILYAGYEEVSQPYSVIRNRESTRKDRSFFIEFSENIGVFLKAAGSLSDIYFIMNIWAELMQAQRIEIQLGRERHIKSFAAGNTELYKWKNLELKKEDIRMDLHFEIGYLNLDSDLKFKAINFVFEELFLHSKRFLHEN